MLHGRDAHRFAPLHLQVRLPVGQLADGQRTSDRSAATAWQSVRTTRAAAPLAGAATDHKQLGRAAGAHARATGDAPLTPIVVPSLRCPNSCRFRLRANLVGWDEDAATTAVAFSPPLPPRAAGATRVELRLSVRQPAAQEGGGGGGEAAEGMMLLEVFAEQLATALGATAAQVPCPP